jgi:hypothetical protein
MHTATPATQVLFTALVVVLAVLFLLAARRVNRWHAGPATWGVPLLVLLFWLAVPGLLAWQGRLDSYAPLPTLGTGMMLVLTLGTVVLAFSRWGRLFAQALPLAALVGFQVFRVSLEALLHSLYEQGVIPVQMTWSGRNYDVVTGLLAVPVALLLWAGRCPKWLLLAWNLLGLALLVNILAVAILSTPVPFRVFTDPPANLLPSTFPFVWLPTFLVQAALFGHLLVFRRWRAAR